LKGLVERTRLPVEIAGLVSLAWSLLAFAIPSNDLDLVVWIEKESTLFPSEATDGRHVALTFEGLPVTSAAVWTVRVTNEGKSYIGAQERQWELALSHPDAELVRMLDKPALSSDRTPVSIVPSSAPNEARIRFGALEHRQFARFHLLLLNAKKEPRHNLRVTTTLSGIPKPLQTYRSPSDRLANRLQWFVLTAFLIAVGWPLLKELRQNRQTRNPKAVLKYLGLTVAASIMFTTVVLLLVAFVAPVVLRLL
jgi:hypothetical protein